MAGRTRYGLSDYNKAQSLVTNRALGQVSFATRKKALEQPQVDCQGRLSLLFEGNLYNLDGLRSNLPSNHQLSNGSAADVVVHMVEEKYRGYNLGAALIRVMKALDGAYCLAVSDGKETIVARDPAGLRPIFYAENNEIMAFASRKTALWEIGLGNVKPLRAGRFVSFSRDGVIIGETIPLREMEWGSAADKKLEYVVGRYEALSRIAVEKRLDNVEKVGCLLSGGVDSCLVTKLVADIAAERGIKVSVYTAGVETSTDIDYAGRFTCELGLEHKIKRLSRDDINSYIPKVVKVVEERDMVQIEAGVGIYAALDMADRDDIRVIFSGQGPDELWGGYTWYPQVIAAEGYDGLQSRMIHDLERADIETLDRENKIAMAHGMEMVFPYVDTEIVKLALSTPPQLKINSAEDKLGKQPHRALAIKLGIPDECAYRRKDAAQHGTGVHDTFSAMARQNGFTPDLVESIGYQSEEVTGEKLASSSRYGQRYADKKLWAIPRHIQLFLDVVAHRYNLLNKPERGKIKAFLEKIRKRKDEVKID
jgi:asparagine synthase (glutamine-hydrolysing)